jgi:hypothetical protein
MYKEAQILTDAEKIYGHEVRDRVEKALDTIPDAFSIKDEIGIIHDYSYPFFGALQKKGPEILKEPGGIQKFEQICSQTVELFSLGKEALQDSAPAFDQHIGGGMEGEMVKKNVTCYQRLSLREAELYLIKIGILEPIK